jgi:hypothetical protein
MLCVSPIQEYFVLRPVYSGISTTGSDGVTSGDEIAVTDQQAKSSLMTAD